MIANRIFDSTPAIATKNYGRLSLNPLHHLDPLGTIFPILLILSGSSFVFGWAKPVPINYYRLKLEV